MCHVTGTPVLLSAGEYLVHRIKRSGLQQQQQHDRHIALYAIVLLGTANSIS